jgi:hypothetical protein
MLILQAILVYVPCPGQNLIASKAAELQVVGEKTDGSNFTAQSSELTITYKPEGIYMNGTLPVSSVSCDDPVVSELIGAINTPEISVETTLPPDQFIFGSETDANFSSPARLYAGSICVDFTIDFTVTHQRIGDMNTFLITGTGVIFLEDLGIDPQGSGIGNTLGFRFRQNVRTSKVG